MARAPLKDVTLNTLIGDNVAKIATPVKEPDEVTDEATDETADETGDESAKTPQVSAEPEAIWLKACGSYPVTDPTDFNARYPVGLAVRVYRVTEFMKCQIAAKLVDVVPAPE